MLAISKALSPALVLPGTRRLLLRNKASFNFCSQQVCNFTAVGGNNSGNSTAAASPSAPTNTKTKSIPHYVESIIGRRPYMEDTFAVYAPPLEESIDSYFAVFDGHAGPHCSVWCAEHLINEVKAHVEKDPEDVEEALKTAFMKLDAEFCEYARKRNMDDGTTANMAVIRRDKETGVAKDLWVANTGDSRSIIIRSRGSTQQMSKDQKAIDEKERIEEMGGFVVDSHGMYRVNGILAVARAFGNATLKPFVTAMPDVKYRRVSTHDTYLCLATDGLWDEVSNEDVGLVFMNGGPELGVKVLTQMAFRRGSYDNITTMCVSLHDV